MYVIGLFPSMYGLLEFDAWVHKKQTPQELGFFYPSAYDSAWYTVSTWQIFVDLIEYIWYF